MTVAAQLQAQQFQLEAEERKPSWAPIEFFHEASRTPPAPTGGALLAKKALDHLLHNRPDQARSEYEEAVKLLWLAGESVDLADALANLAYTTADRGRALALYEDARNIYRKLGVVRSEAIVTRNIATQLASLGERARPQGTFHDAIDLARRVGDARTEGLALFSLAGLQEDEGRLPEALALAEQALQLFQRFGDPEWEGATHAMIATFHALTGNAETASAAYMQAHERLRAAPRNYSLGETLRGVARRLRQLRMVPLAHDLYEAAVAVYVELGDVELEATVLRELGTLHADVAELGIARAFYELASSLHQSAGERRIDAIALGSLSSMYSQLGQLVMARAIELKALRIHRDLGDIAGEATALGSLGSYEERLGHLDTAEQLYTQGLDLARRAGDRTQEALCLMGLAGVYHQTRRGTASRELHDKALAIATDINATDLIDAIAFARKIAQRDNEVRARSEDIRRLLNEWITDDSGHDESTWPALKRDLEEDRLSSRKLFHG